MTTSKIDQFFSQNNKHNFHYPKFQISAQKSMYDNKMAYLIIVGTPSRPRDEGQTYTTNNHINTPQHTTVHLGTHHKSKAL